MRSTRKIARRASAAAAVALAILLCIPAASRPQDPADRLLANRIFSFAFEHKLIEKPAGEVVAAVGRQFLGKPYEANTLDRGSGSEQLVADLHSFDCVTYVENVLALARCIKSNTLSFDAYSGELQKIRYRAGVIDGYASRLHYFSDWIGDNEKKGIVRDVTRSLGGVRYTKQIDFMSTHRSLYPKLRNDSDYHRLQSVEHALAARDSLFYIPKSAIARAESQIRSGDLIAITTRQKGLDVSHTGIALRAGDGSLRLMHAPDTGDSIRISAETLARHVLAHPAQTGIIVLRPLEP